MIDMPAKSLRLQLLRKSQRMVPVRRLLPSKVINGKVRKLGLNGPA